jgi:diguanylate cyclase (GGDEF)-like protein/PAS domain S-box-containing protein
LTQQNFRKIFTVYFIVFGFIITLFTTLISYNISINDTHKAIAKQAESIAFIKLTNIVQPMVKQMEDIVLSISNSEDMALYTHSKDEHTRKHLESIFYAIAGTNNQIMQLRYLDKNGMEIVRVDRQIETAPPFIVTREKLQDKSKRDYFQIVSKMTKSHLWYSKIDLNIENGKIEVPYRPTFRIAIPIFKEQKFEGMVIVNLLLNNLIKAIKTSSVFEHYVVDKDGYFILHHNDNYSWNKYTRTHRELTQDFPQDASLILKGDTKGEEFFAYSLDSIFNNEDNAKLILKPKSEYKEQLLNEKIQSSLIVVILSILLSILMALFASSTPSKLQKALLVANNELKRFAKIIDKYVITASTKKDTTITNVSSAFSASCGYKKEELLGKKIDIIKHEDTKQKTYEEMWSTLSAGNEWNGEIKNKKKDGSEYWLEQNIIPIKDGSGEVDSYIAVGIDITTKKEIETLSSTDMLTEIFNRRKIEEFLEIEISRSRRYNRSLSLIILDIDHFKHINDTFGHNTGDIALKQTADVVKNAIRDNDIFGRWGGEEFIIICPETSKNEAFIVAQKVRKAIDDFKFDIIERETISLGLAEFEEENTKDELIHNADIALYLSKANGRNKVTLYHSDSIENIATEQPHHI